MELRSLKELLGHRKKLLKLLEHRTPIDELWPAEMEAVSKAAVERELADVDAEITERTGATIETPKGD